MSQANCLATMSSAKSKPTRRRALTLLGVGLPAISVGSRAGANEPARAAVSEIVALFSNWQFAIERMNTAIEAMAAAECRFVKSRPATPAVLEWKNAPRAWKIRMLNEPEHAHLIQDRRVITMHMADDLAARTFRSSDVWVDTVFAAARTHYFDVEKQAKDRSGLTAAIDGSALLGGHRLFNPTRSIICGADRSCSAFSV